MASVLVIGVGSTGLSAMEYAQQYYYEFTKQNSPLNTAFMFIETDDNRHPKVVSNGKTDIKSCYICPKNITATLNGWQSQYAWMPTEADVLNQHAGAAGQPAYGRVALWSEEQNVRALITTLYQQIGGNASTNIYLVGSLTGGTGTGIFLDIAYMVRQITLNTNIFGMFMLPGGKDVGDATMSALYENAYSSLKSLDKYSKSNDGKNFECTLPGGTKIDSLRAPFYNVEFFTQDFANASASIPNLSTLVQSVGFALGLRLLDITNQGAPFQDCINAKYVDYMSKVPAGIFTSVGFNVFQYPESMLEEYLTTKLIHENVLNRWADTDNYIDENGTNCSIQGVLAKLKVQTRVFVQNAIEESIEKCQGQSTLGNQTFKLAIESEIEKIMTKDYKAPSEKNYIFSLFDSNSSAPKLYSAIHGQAIDLRNDLISRIAKYIDEESTRYQNLTIIKAIIELVGESIETIVKEWNKRYKIDGTAVRWNTVWQKVLTERFKNSAVYSILLSKKDWYHEALMGSAKLCYFNEFMPMLDAVADSLLSRNQATDMATPDGVLLPSIQSFNSILSKVNTLLSPTNANSLVARENVLMGQLSMNNNSQIYYLYQGNSFDADIKQAMGKYQNQPARLEYDTISKNSLWQFLYASTEEEIKSQMISEGLLFIQLLALFDSNSVVNIMKNLPTSHPAYNKVNNILNGTAANMMGDVPAMVRLVQTEQFVPHLCLKLIMVSALPENNASGIVKSMANGNVFSTTNSNFVQLPSMKNTVVVYQEYGYLGQKDGMDRAFNPLLHISYQDQVRQAIKAKIDYNIFDESVRLAYIDESELMDMSNINIK